MFMPHRTDPDHIKSIMRRKATRGRVDPVPFTYNPLHDLESIWWIATFLIFLYFTVGGHDRQLLNIDVDKLFSTSEHTSRSAAFTSPTRYMQMVDHLPAQLQQHGEQLDLFRELLLLAYQSAESTPDINRAAFDSSLYEVLKEALCELRDNPGSLAACVNDTMKQTLADECEEVNKNFGDVQSSPSVRKGKVVNKQTSIGDAMPRRSTRLRKTMSEDDEDVEHAESSHSPGKRKKMNDRKADQSDRAAESSHSARKRQTTNERDLTEDEEGAESNRSTRKRQKQKDDHSDRAAESSRSARKRKKANKQELTEDDERFEGAKSSSHSPRKRNKVDEQKKRPEFWDRQV